MRPVSDSGVTPPVADALATTVSAHFKMIFIFIAVLTVACAAGNIWMAIGIVEPTDSQRDVMATMSTLWKMGFGSMVGLVGAKAS